MLSFLYFLYFFLVVWFVIFSTNDFNFILFCFVLWRKQHKESVYDYNEGDSES